MTQSPIVSSVITEVCLNLHISALYLLIRPFKARNAISQITVTGIAQDASGRDVPLILHRSTAPPDLVEPTLHEGFPDPSKRLLSSLPELGDLQFCISLGERIGSGRAGLVHEVTPVSLVSLSQGECPMALPPLVLKLARPNRCAFMAREAWFYDELELLQGVCIPRCYGWFEATLPQDGLRVPAWEFEPTRDSSVVFPDGLLKDLSQARNRVSILLLERLEGELPFGKENLPETLLDELE